jgi:hypothetical protein
VLDNIQLPESLRRVIGVYNSHRAGPLTIQVSTDALSPQTPGVLLAASGSADPPAEANQVADHPITQHVSFPLITGTQPPAGWLPLVTNGKTCLLAVHDSPPQVWVSLNDPNWPSTPDYVIFWTNVFDWLGGKEGDFLLQRDPPPPAQSMQHEAIDLTPAVCISALGLMAASLVRKRQPQLSTSTNPAQSIQSPDR